MSMRQSAGVMNTTILGCEAIEILDAKSRTLSSWDRAKGVRPTEIRSRHTARNHGDQIKARGH